MNDTIARVLQRLKRPAAGLVQQLIEAAQRSNPQWLDARRGLARVETASGKLSHRCDGPGNGPARDESDADGPPRPSVPSRALHKTVTRLV
jgi:hypothetical protein